MFHKKTLGAAIAVALSFGVSAVQAASFDKYPSVGMMGGNALTTGYVIDTPLTYAYEQFSSTDTLKGPLNYPFRVRYTIDEDLSNVDAYITFTLSGNATWGEPLQSIKNFAFQLADGTGPTVTTPQVSLSQGGQTTDSSASFLINTSKVTWPTEVVFDFNFTVKNANKALKTTGGQIAITAQLVKADGANFTTGTALAASLSTTLATSAEGLAVTFQGPQDGNPAYISVENNGNTFEGDGKLSETQISYGTIGLENKGKLDKTANCLPNVGYLTDETLLVNLCGMSPLWASDMKQGSLVIEDGNFNASGKASDGHVYVKIGSTTSNYLKASEFTNPTTAKWKFTADDLKNMNETVPMEARQVVLEVNGTEAVIENRQIQPKGTLVIEYGSGNAVTRTAFLRHLKKNGTVCTLYNIPPSNALDVVNIRVTNDSTLDTAFVKGKLRDMDNKVIFTGKTLIEQGGLKPKQTVRLQMEDLTADGASWTGRAVLVLESNIPHPLMQVYGLLRAREATGFPETPLMNMSTGATGNSCD